MMARHQDTNVCVWGGGRTPFNNSAPGVGGGGVGGGGGSHTTHPPPRPTPKILGPFFSFTPSAQLVTVVAYLVPVFVRCFCLLYCVSMYSSCGFFVHKVEEGGCLFSMVRVDVSDRNRVLNAVKE